MRNIIIKTTQNTPHTSGDQEEDFISFNYDRTFLALLLVINIISGLILYQWLFLG